jgi:hypothetical protein
LENAETRFAAAQTIRAVQSGFCVFLGKAFVHRTTFGKPHHALWPRLQGKLNREWRVYRETLPFWQFKGRRRSPVNLLDLAVSGLLPAVLI